MSTATSHIRPYRGMLPTLGARCYIDRAASVIGDVVIGEDSSVWPACVVRGDIHRIRIGARTNIQDGSILHVTHAGQYTGDGFPCTIGDDVTIGHAAVIHACTLEDACLIGMHATVLDGAVVRKHGFVAAGSVIAPGKIVGEAELWMGNPARCVRVLDAAQIEQLYYSAAHYVRLKDHYVAQDAADLAASP